MKVKSSVIKLGFGLAVLVAGAVWLGVMPALKAATRYESRLVIAHRSLDRTESRADDIRTLADTLTEARRFAETNTKPIVDQDASALMHEIGEFLTTMRVSSHQMTQDRAFELEGVRITPVSLTMRASYPDLINLLGRIERGDRLVRVVRVRIDLPRGAAPGSPGLDIEVGFESIAPVIEQRGVIASVNEEADR